MSRDESSAERRLPEIALEAFDVEFRDWARYAAFLRARLGREPGRILDVGGGNGRFLDALLDLYPDATGVCVDLAASMIERNRPHPRKEAVVGDASSLGVARGAEGFDLITVNVLLHHLVGDDEASTRVNVVSCLRQVRELLAEGGRVVVYEQVYDPRLALGPDPGSVIYRLTRIRSPLLAGLLRRLGANTAGVGVRFRSRAGWRALLLEAGFSIEAEAAMKVDRIPVPRRLFFNLGYFASHIFLARA